MQKIKQPSYFATTKKMAKENGLIQIGSNLFEISLASVLNEREKAAFEKSLSYVSAAFHDVFYGTEKDEGSEFEYSSGTATFQYQNVYSLKTGKLRYRVFFLVNLKNTRFERTSVYEEFKVSSDENLQANLDFDNEFDVEI